MTLPPSADLLRWLARKGASFCVDSITPEDGGPWQIAWQADNGALLTSGEMVVTCKTERGDTWHYKAPCPARLETRWPTGAVVRGGTRIGVIHYGDALERLLRDRREEERRECQTATQAWRRARAELAAAGQRLHAATQVCARLAAEWAGLRRENAARLQQCRRLAAAARHPLRNLAPDRFLAALLKQLPPGPLPTVPDDLHLQLLQLCELLERWAAPAGMPAPPPADTEAAAALLEQLYAGLYPGWEDRLAGLPPELREEAYRLWQQLAHAHRRALATASSHPRVPT